MAKKSFTKAVKLGGLSIGESTARMGFRFSRDEIGIEDADAMFSGSRCSAKIELKVDEAQAVLKIGTKKIGEIEPIEGVCDIKGFHATAESFSAGMTFQLSEVKVDHLARFSGKEVKMKLIRTGDIPEEEGEESAGDEGEGERDLLGGTEPKAERRPRG